MTTTNTRFSIISDDLSRQQNELVSLFETNKTLSIPQISRRLGVSQSRARFLVSEIRKEGYAIYRTSRGGGKFTYYLGAPSREMVAVAAAVITGASLFNAPA